MLKYVLLTVAVAIFSFSSVFADNYKEIKCLKPCGDYEKADKMLNIVYKKLKHKLNQEETKLLVNAQRAWIKLRDNHCELVEYKNRGASGWPSNIEKCLENFTANRINELKVILKDRIFYEELGIE